MKARALGATARARRAARVALISGIALLVSGGAGCAGFGFDFGGPSSLEISSGRTGGLLSPSFVTAVYASPDENTADIYISDLPLAALTAPDTAPLDNASGVIVHVHYFLTPVAGRTPIAFDASNVGVRLFVLTPASDPDEPPTIGVYGGGGFLLPSDDPDGDATSGRIKRATLRLIAAAPGFEDRLATAIVDGAIRASRDEPSARAISETIAAMLEEREAVEASPVPPVEPGEASDAPDETESQPAPDATPPPAEASETPATTEPPPAPGR